MMLFILALIGVVLKIISAIVFIFLFIWSIKKRNSIFIIILFAVLGTGSIISVIRTHKFISSIPSNYKSYFFISKISWEKYTDKNKTFSVLFPKNSIEEKESDETQWAILRYFENKYIFRGFYVKITFDTSVEEQITPILNNPDFVFFAKKTYTQNKRKFIRITMKRKDDERVYYFFQLEENNHNVYELGVNANNIRAKDTKKYFNSFMILNDNISSPKDLE